jgi:hypothetical protein
MSLILISAMRIVGERKGEKKREKGRGVSVRSWCLFPLKRRGRRGILVSSL